jgi:hypothetical protein
VGQEVPLLISQFVLSLLSAIPAAGDPEMQRTAAAHAAAPVPASAAVPEAIPTAYSRLPAKAVPAPAGWMLSVEGATRAPVDVGGQVTLESPYHLRFFAGYGWVPTAYSGLYTGIASAASGDAQVTAVLNHASFQGRTFRTAIGVWPFAATGLHLDVGYARLSLDGEVDLAGSGVPALASQSGVYRSHTTVDAWLVEVGSQVEGWGVVFGFAFGLMRTYAAQTTITGSGAAAGLSLDSLAQQTDTALTSYGYVPTLTFRLGFDVLSLRSWASDAGAPG